MRLPRLLFLPYNSDLNFLLIGFRCMKLQKPDLVHSPVSYCLNYNQVLTNTEQKVTTHLYLQQASLKSVTGVSSA